MGDWCLLFIYLEKTMIKKGKYRHFKGGLYEVLEIGTDSESLTEVVIYKSLKDDSIWVRPMKMFSEKVEKDGQIFSRFEYLGD